jgi:hypothetical protein
MLQQAGVRPSRKDCYGYYGYTYTLWLPATGQPSILPCDPCCFVYQLVLIVPPPVAPRGRLLRSVAERGTPSMLAAENFSSQAPRSLIGNLLSKSPAKSRFPSGPLRTVLQCDQCHEFHASRAGLGSIVGDWIANRTATWSGVGMVR